MNLWTCGLLRIVYIRALRCRHAAMSLIMAQGWVGSSSTLVKEKNEEKNFAIDIGTLVHMFFCERRSHETCVYFSRLVV